MTSVAAPAAKTKASRRPYIFSMMPSQCLPLSMARLLKSLILFVAADRSSFLMRFTTALSKAR